MKLIDLINGKIKNYEKRIGRPPYLYCDNSDDIFVAQSIDYLFMIYKNNLTEAKKINVFAYGYKKDANDILEYIEPSVLTKRFEKFFKQGIYECLDEDRNLEYMNFDSLIKMYNQDRNMLVNCKTLEEVILEELNTPLNKR